MFCFVFTRSKEFLLCNHRIAIKIRKFNTDTILLSDLQFIFKFYQHSNNSPYSSILLPSPVYNLGSCIAFSRCVCLVCFNGTVLLLLFVFYDLDVLKTAEQLLCRLFHNFHLSDVSAWLDSDNALLVEITQILCPFRTIILGGTWCSFDSFLVILTLRT